MNKLIDQPCELTWLETGKMEPVNFGSPKRFEPSRQVFESVRLAVLFVMESMSAHNRGHSIIHVGEIKLSYEDIKSIYASIKPV